MSWPIREALEAYAHRARRAAERRYDADFLHWAVLAPHVPRAKRRAPPELPSILKGKGPARG